MTTENKPPLQAKLQSPACLVPWNHLIADAVVWIALVLIFVVFRGILLWVFRVQLSPDSGWSAVVRCFRTGVHYDIQIATYALLPSLLLTMTGFIKSMGSWHTRVRTVTVAFSLTVCIICFVTDLAYFAEYQDQFNDWIFGLIYDDRGAILQTIWKGYPIVWLTLGMLATISLGIWIVRKAVRGISSQVSIPARFSSGFFRVLIPVLMAGLIVLGARGSLGRRPMQLKDAATTGDGFLNKLVLNPFSALKYAIAQHRRLQSSTGLGSFLPDGDIAGAARALFPQKTNATNLDEYLARVATGSPVKPKHIFIVMMESYDAWPTQPPFAEWGLTKNLARLGKEGIQVPAFVSAAGGTMPSLNAIITGLPFTDINANYRPSIRAGLPTSIAPIFKKLGYRTRFFYAGYLSWQRLGDFCREQGFDEVFGGDEMSAKLTGNEWGVDDEVLFRFILDHTGDEPTFDMIMTTSYHPPFSVDLAAKGFSDEFLTNTEIGRQLAPDQKRIYGHLWYADRALGEFADACEQRLERPLLAVTGDHFSRRYPPGLRPTLFERKAVPFVLSGREVLAQVSRPVALAGSHLDITPTLIGLAAPPGFTYHSAGQDLLDPARTQLGFGAGAVVGTNFIYETASMAPAEDLLGRPVVAPTNSLAMIYNRLHALGWWRVMQGNSFPTNTPRTSVSAPAPR